MEHSRDDEAGTGHYDWDHILLHRRRLLRHVSNFCSGRWELSTGRWQRWIIHENLRWLMAFGLRCINLRAEVWKGKHIIRVELLINYWQDLSLQLPNRSVFWQSNCQIWKAISVNWAFGRAYFKWRRFISSSECVNHDHPKLVASFHFHSLRPDWPFMCAIPNEVGIAESRSDCIGPLTICNPPILWCI